MLITPFSTTSGSTPFLIWTSVGATVRLIRNLIVWLPSAGLSHTFGSLVVLITSIALMRSVSDERFVIFTCWNESRNSQVPQGGFVVAPPQTLEMCVALKTTWPGSSFEADTSMNPPPIEALMLTCFVIVPTSFTKSSSWRPEKMTTFELNGTSSENWLPPPLSCPLPAASERLLTWPLMCAAWMLGPLSVVTQSATWSSPSITSASSRGPA